MKKRRFNFIEVTLGLFALTTIVACGSSEKKKVKLDADEVEVSIPCSGTEFQSTNKIFRANASGESLDQMTAKKKAYSNARAQLATDIGGVIKRVNDNYIKSSEFNNKEEVLERFEDNTRTVVNQKIGGVKNICEKAVKVKSSGKYKYYVAIELSDDLIKAMGESLSKDENLKVDYNYEKFKDTFEKEMANMDK